MEPLEQQGARPGGRPRPAGEPVWDLPAGHTGQPGLGRPGSARGPATPQSRPAWEPAWAGQGAGHPPEPPGLEPGQGRPGARPGARPGPARGPATHQRHPACSPA